MLNETFKTIYKKSKWAFLFVHFFTVLGVFYFASLLANFEVESPLSLSFALFTSLANMLFIANKLNDAKHK